MDNDKIKIEYNKSKTAAVVLAVFFSFWSWLYTYGKNAMKFWIIIAVYAVIPVVFYSILSTLSAMSAYYYIMGLLSFGIWLWCLLDNSLKPNDFYKYIFKRQKNKGSTSPEFIES